MLLGSTADGVIRKATCPVLVIRSAAAFPPDRVEIPVDLSPISAIPNRFGVYLHDTSAPSLFGRTQRTFSHGCIRIEKPFELAVWLLRDDPRWTPEAIRAGIDAGGERNVPLPVKVPVHVAYWTAWAGDDGVLRLGPDVYKRDVELAQLLAGEGR